MQLEAEHIVQRRTAQGEDQPQQRTGAPTAVETHGCHHHADGVGHVGQQEENTHRQEADPRVVSGGGEGCHQQRGKVVNEERQYQIEDAVEQGAGITGHG